MLLFLNLDAYVFEAKDSLCEEGSNLSTALCSSFTYWGEPERAPH